MEEKDVKATEVKATKTTTRKAPAKTTKTAPKEDGELKAKLEQAEKEKQEMMEMLKNLQSQVDSMKNQQPQYIIQQQGGSDTPCEIGCRLFCGAVLTSPSGDVEITLKHGEEVEVTVREMNEVFRSQFGYKKMFEKGVLYFVDPEMYDHFKIRNPIDLSEDVIVEHLLDEDYNRMIKYLSTITNGRRDDMVCHTICYNTAMLYSKGKLENWAYANRVNFESYMKVKVDDVVATIKRAKDLLDLN